MAGAFTAVDLSQLPFPDAVEALDYETILAGMVTELKTRAPMFGALLESDPAFKILEIAAYYVMLERQRVNEAVKAVTLAYALRADLDQIAARYNVARLLLDAGNPDSVPPSLPVYEDDTSLRRRVQLSFEGFSTAGPKGAYIFHALSADADVLDAGVESPSPGLVEVAVLSRTGTGAADTGLVAAVNKALNAESVRPLTDRVSVKSAVIVNYSISATLTIFSGPDSAVVLASARDAIQEYVVSSRRLGRDITLSGIYSALHQEGVQNVNLIQPTASIVNGWDRAPYCTNITLSVGGIGE